MRKRKFIYITLIMTVFFASVSCCCVQRKASASADVPKCHQKASSQKDHHPADCPCSHIISLAAEQAIELAPNVPSDLYKSKDMAVNYGNLGGFGSITQYVLRSDKDNSEFFDTSPPLFIQFSNLRL